VAEEEKNGEERRGWLGFGPANVALLVLAVASIVTGYVLLDRGSITAAPLLLVLGYVVLIPAGIVLGYRKLGDS